MKIYEAAGVANAGRIVSERGGRGKKSVDEKVDERARQRKGYESCLNTSDPLFCSVSLCILCTIF